MIYLLKGHGSCQRGYVWTKDNNNLNNSFKKRSQQRCDRIFVVIFAPAVNENLLEQNI